MQNVKELADVANVIVIATNGLTNTHRYIGSHDFSHVL